MMQQTHLSNFKTHFQINNVDHNNSSRQFVSFEKKLKNLKQDSIVQQLDPSPNRTYLNLPVTAKINRIIYNFRSHSNSISNQVTELNQRLEQKRKVVVCSKNHVHKKKVCISKKPRSQNGSPIVDLNISKNRFNSVFKLKLNSSIRHLLNKPEVKSKLDLMTT